MSTQTYGFLVPIREFCLLNSSDEDVKIQYGGETRTIPAANKVLLPHKKYDDVCHSLQLEDGRFVPGTVVLRDVYDIDKLSGQETQVWSAANAVKATLGIDVKTGIASSRYAEKGISIVPPGADLATIRKVAKDGRVRNERWKLSQAFLTVASHEQRNDKRQSLNLAPVPATPEYRAALNLISRAEEIELEAAKQAVFEDNNLVYIAEEANWQLEDTPADVPVVDLNADEPEPVSLAEPEVEAKPLSKAEQTKLRLEETAKIIEEGRAKKAG